MFLGSSARAAETACPGLEATVPKSRWGPVQFPLEMPLSVLRMAAFLLCPRRVFYLSVPRWCLSLSVPISLYKDTPVLLDLGPPPWPHFHLIYLLSFEVQKVRTLAYE